MADDAAPIDIRASCAADLRGVLAVHASAFPTDGEARLVDLLTSRGKARVSLVAEHRDEIIGHVLFSPVEIVGTRGGPPGLGLAPLAVSPAYQGRGVGARLVEAGLAVCRQLDCPFAVVLGEPEYYGRFGFRRASDFGLANEYHADDAFQVIELRPGSLANSKGLVKYAGELAEVFGGDSH